MKIKNKVKFFVYVFLFVGLLVILFTAQFRKETYYDLRTLKEKRIYYIYNLKFCEMNAKNYESEFLEKIDVYYGQEQYVFFAAKTWSLNGVGYLDGKYGSAISHFIFFVKNISELQKPLEVKKEKIKKAFVFLRENNDIGIIELTDQLLEK